MKRRTQVRNIVVLSALIIFVVVVFVAFGSGLLTSRIPAHLNQLSSGWSVKCGDLTYDDVEISSFSISGLKRGDVISFSRKLQSTSILAPTLMFKSKHCVVDVYIDNKIVYSYGREYYQQGKFVPKNYNLVNLEKFDKEHALEIRFVVAEDNVVKDFSPVYYGTKRELIRYFFQYNRMPMFTGGFFAIYACVLATLGAYLFMTKRTDVTIFVNAALSISFGIYCYSYNDILAFVSDKNMLFSTLEFMIMYTLPLLITLFIHVTHPDTAKEAQGSLFVLNISMPVIFSFFHFTGMIHYIHFLMLFQIVVIIENIIILPQLVIGLKNEYKNRDEAKVFSEMGANNFLMLGYIILLIFVIVEIVQFNMTSFYTDNNGVNFYFRSSMLDLGMLGFVICLFVYYFLNGIEHMNAKKVREELEGLAYTDSLTGLMNRAKCTQYAFTLRVPYGVVNLDLDRLKKVNDTYGHLEGDKMIKAFADLLTRTFVDADLIGRTGGDEFMLIFENPKEGKCEESIKLLEEKLREYNETEGASEKFTLSASAGYAYSSEIGDKNFKFAYYLADTRMYEMKESHHA